MRAGNVVTRWTLPTGVKVLVISGLLLVSCFMVGWRDEAERFFLENFASVPLRLSFSGNFSNRTFHVISRSFTLGNKLTHIQCSIASVSRLTPPC